MRRASRSQGIGRPVARAGRQRRQVRCRDGRMLSRVVAKIPGPNQKPDQARQSQDHERAAPRREQKQRGHQRRCHCVSDAAKRMRDPLREAPVAEPGSKLDIARVAVGNAAPSPKPRARRRAKSDTNPLAAPVSMVETPTIAQHADSVRRGPNLSPIQPPMSWKKA